MPLLYAFIHAYTIYAYSLYAGGADGGWGGGGEGGADGLRKGVSGKGQKVKSLYTYTIYVFSFQGCILYMDIYVGAHCYLARNHCASRY